jgi:arylformamidase
MDYDRLYNNRLLVPEFATHLRQWAANSERTRAELPCELDLAYGDHPSEKLDVFRADVPNSPVLVFLHGGYWRSLDKRDHSFVARPFVEAGVTVVVPNYALCPAVTIPHITLQSVRAVAWTWRDIERFGGDPGRITVAGHSAGGQLAAMMLACQWQRLDAGLPRDVVRSALAISALHDLEPIRQTPFLQPDLRLTPADAVKASPARLPAPPHGVLYSVCGGAESEEFLRQNALIREAWGATRVPLCEALPGLNHFTVLEAFADPRHALHRYALDLLRT